MMHSSLLMVLSFSLLSSACDSAPQMAGANASDGITPVHRDAGQLLMSATAVEDADTTPCPAAREIEVVARDSKLRIQTYLTKNPHCGNEPEGPDFRAYIVSEVYDFEGRRIYAGTSPLGALWIYDQRPAQKNPAWVIEMFDDNDGARSMFTFTAEDVNDEDPSALEASIIQVSGARTLHSR